jgi:hypothetical protein
LSQIYAQNVITITALTMADYSAQKVPDLKKILSERGLIVSGNKADLVARLLEDDKKKSGDKPG